jgi:hypothetical protein
MVGCVDRGEPLAVEIFFRQSRVLHRKARRPREILGGGFTRFTRFAAEPIDRRFSDSRDGSFSSNAHGDFLRWFFNRDSSVQLGCQGKEKSC